MKIISIGGMIGTSYLTSAAPSSLSPSWSLKWLAHRGCTSEEGVRAVQRLSSLGVQVLERPADTSEEKVWAGEGRMCSSKQAQPAERWEANLGWGLRAWSPYSAAQARWAHPGPHNGAVSAARWQECPRWVHFPFSLKQRQWGRTNGAVLYFPVLNYHPETLSGKRLIWCHF